MMVSVRFWGVCLGCLLDTAKHLFPQPHGLEVVSLVVLDHQSLDRIKRNQLDLTHIT